MNLRKLVKKVIYQAIIQGWSYHQGIDVPSDFKKVYNGYIKAGQESYALDNLGSLYKDGLGVKADFNKAIDYFKVQ